MRSNDTSVEHPPAARLFKISTVPWLILRRTCLCPQPDTGPLWPSPLTFARFLIDREDVYRGALRTLTLKHTELDAEDRPNIKERTLNVRIPRGVSQGQHIRLAKQGSAGIGKGGAVDLKIRSNSTNGRKLRLKGRGIPAKVPGDLCVVLQIA